MKSVATILAVAATISTGAHATSWRGKSPAKPPGKLFTIGPVKTSSGLAVSVSGRGMSQGAVRVHGTTDKAVARREGLALVGRRVCKPAGRKAEALRPAKSEGRARWVLFYRCL